MKEVAKLFGILLFIGVISYGSAYKSWIRLSYELNKLEIIEKFCINKEETSFSCEGKCHLNVELKKVEEQSPNGEAPVINEEQSLTLFHTYVNKLELNKQHLISHLNCNYVNHYVYSSTASIFRPPRA